MGFRPKRWRTAWGFKNQTTRTSRRFLFSIGQNLPARESCCMTKSYSKRIVNTLSIFYSKFLVAIFYLQNQHKAAAKAFIKNYLHDISEKDACKQYKHHVETRYHISSDSEGPQNQSLKCSLAGGLRPSTSIYSQIHTMCLETSTQNRK